MQVFGLPGHVTRNGRRASRLLDAQTPSIEAARRRDAVARWHGARRTGLNAEHAAEAVAVPRATLYRWDKAPVPKSRRPHRMRRKNWSPALRAEVERLRLDFPMWGKDKLGPILRDQGFAVSNATVGRIIESLIARGRVARVRDLIRLLPPRSPKLNGAVERCNGAWRYEFYACRDLPNDINRIAEHVDAFQHLYNPASQHPSVYAVEVNRFC